MCRFRLLPSLEQAAALVEHCHHARFVWNLAVEQQRHWQPGRQAPGYNDQYAQLTAARCRANGGFARQIGTQNRRLPPGYFGLPCAPGPT
ncbi:MAG TPA: helix-turn-helix domain-containing protein [Mycobacterium sp.]|nr:helix-turn-helix domain-containing protein [Mycobacterium sp.]